MTLFNTKYIYLKNTTSLTINWQFLYSLDKDLINLVLSYLIRDSKFNMEKTIFYINIIISFLAYIFGGFDYPFISLMLVILLDYITGILKAIYKKNLNSSLGRKGIIKKFGYLFIVILAT